jgi:transcriptional regulator GlxA family with amidase domain
LGPTPARCATPRGFFGKPGQSTIRSVERVRIDVAAVSLVGSKTRIEYIAGAVG